MVLALGFDTRFARSRPLDLQVPFSIRFETLNMNNNRGVPVNRGSRRFS